MANFGDTGIGGSARLPLPDNLKGKMQQWEDWSLQVEAYVSLFRVEALRVLENAEVATAPITDDALERLGAQDRISRHWVSEVQQTIALLTDTNHK